MRRVTSKGFTLIELLVVIAIIAILAAILFPVYLSVKQRAWQQRCLGNLTQLSRAFSLYQNDNCGGTPILLAKVDGSWPAGRIDWCGMRKTIGGEYVYPEKGSLWRYIRTRGVYICPMDVNREAKGFPNSTLAMRIALPLSYDINGGLGQAVKLDALPGAARMSRLLLFIHESRDTINDGLFAWESNVDEPSPVHYDGTTVSYCDGHARWRSVKQLKQELDSGVWDAWRR